MIHENDPKDNEDEKEESLGEILQCTRYAALLQHTYYGCAVSQVQHMVSAYHTDGASGAMGGGNLRAALLFYVRERDRDMTDALLDHFFQQHRELLDPHFLQIVTAAAILRRDAVSYRRLMAMNDGATCPAETVASELADVRRSVWAVEEESLATKGERLLQSLVDAADETERAVRDCGVPSGHPGNMQTLLRNLRPDPAFCQYQTGG